MKGNFSLQKQARHRGGAISSIYANMTLYELENLIQNKYHRNSKGKIENHYRAKTKVNLVRYADDFIITANTKEISDKLKETVSQFLKERGLTLSEEKTIITHIDEGFDFLGWTFLKYKEKLIVKPSKSSIKTLIRKCSTIILKEMKAGTQSELIRRLNQIIRGWTNYHKHVVASHAFLYINNTLYILLQRWAKHRHPNKNSLWRLNRYWHEKNGKRWLFMTDEYSLINLRRIQIVRHPKLQISKNPFIHKEYYEHRNCY